MARKPESKLWEEFKRVLTRWQTQHGVRGYAERIEATTVDGIPDVHYAYSGLVIPSGRWVGPREGWVELKVLPSWPKRPTTKVNIAHFVKVQQDWAARHVLAGGRWRMLLKVRDAGDGQPEYLLLDCRTALLIAARQLTKDDVYAAALRCGLEEVMGGL